MDNELKSHCFQVHGECMCTVQFKLSKWNPKIRIKERLVGRKKREKKLSPCNFLFR